VHHPGEPAVVGERADLLIEAVTAGAVAMRAVS